MPTNLPPEYFEAEERFREAESVREKIVSLEELLGTIPKHKGTDKLRADLRRRLSKLKASAETQKKAGKHESVYHVEKQGAARVVVAGPPNVGKSTLVAALTNAAPKVSSSPFTTWTPTPGMMETEDVQVQLIDTPPLNATHVEPELFDLIRSADLVLLIVDLQAFPLRQRDDALALLNEHRIRLLPDGHAAAEDGLKSLPAVLLVNKNDGEAWDEELRVFRELAQGDWAIVGVSAKTGRNLEELRRGLFERLHIVRIYSKLPGKSMDRGAPFVLPRGATVEDFAAKVHHDFVKELKTARIWGRHVYDGQMVGRDHVLEDSDIVELHR